MDEKTKQRRQLAVENILPIVESLSESEWRRIVSIVDMHFSTKAAKVRLDGGEIETLKKSLQAELL